MCIKNEAYQEVIAIPIKDNGTEWSDDQPVLHLDVKTMMTQEEEEDEISCFAKAELLEHLKISSPLRVLITDLTAKRLGGGGDPFDLSTEVSTAFPSQHMITRTTPTISSSSLSVVLLDERERCPNDHYDAIDGATPMDPSSSSFDNEDPWQKKKRRRRRRRVRMVVAGAVGCGLMGGVFLGSAGHLWPVPRLALSYFGLLPRLESAEKMFAQRRPEFLVLGGGAEEVPKSRRPRNCYAIISVTHYCINSQIALFQDYLERTQQAEEGFIESLLLF
jgi:hypothetical protein